MELREGIPRYREDDEYLLFLRKEGYGHIRQVHGVRNLLYHQPQVSVLPESHHGSTWVADRTVDFLCAHRDRPWGPWKCTYYLQGGWEELFHLQEDPLEMSNLLLDNPTREVRQMGDRLKRRLTEWEREHGFATSFDGDGKLVRAPLSAGRGGSGGPVATNGQFPIWVDNLPPEEKARLESPGEFVLNAMRHEWTYKLTDLNLRHFRRVGGSLAGTEEQRLLDEL